MKAAKKRYHKKIPKFWKLLKQEEPRSYRNAWTGLGPFTIKWPENEEDLLMDDYEASEEEISQEDSKILEDTTESTAAIQSTQDTQS